MSAVSSVGVREALANWETINAKCLLLVERQNWLSDNVTQAFSTACVENDLILVEYSFHVRRAELVLHAVPTRSKHVA